MNQDIVTFIIVGICVLIVVLGILRFLFSKPRKGKACNCGCGSLASSSVCNGCAFQDEQNREDNAACQTCSKPFAEGPGLGI